MKPTSLCCTALVALLAACGSSTQQAAPETYPVANPIVADTATYSEYVAELTALQNVEVRARVQGYIERIHVDEGAAVREGQVLFSISSAAYAQKAQKAEAAVQSAQAKLEAARVDLTNTERLLAKDIISQPELTAKRAKITALEADLTEARTDAAKAAMNLGFTEVKAPFDGTINRIPNKRGALVEEGDLLTSITNNSAVFAYFELSERAYLDLATAGIDEREKQVSLVLANGANYSEPGVIETSESEFDKSTGSIAFRARFANPKGLLKHGGTGKVRVRTALGKALLVPQQATFEVQGNTYVYVLDGESKARMRQVSPTHRLAKDFVIGEGLSASDRFLVEGIQRVKDGDAVTAEVPTAPLAERKTTQP